MPTQDNWYTPVEITEITKSINHAKSFSDVWIDTLTNFFNKLNRNIVITNIYYLFFINVHPKGSRPGPYFLCN